MKRYFISSGLKLTYSTSNNIFLLLLLIASVIHGQESLSNFADHKSENKSIVVRTDQWQKVRITPYGNYIIRVQAIRNNEEYFPDDRYEMVEHHDWPGELSIKDGVQEIQYLSSIPDGISVILKKNPVRLIYILNNNLKEILEEKSGVTWNGDTVSVSFKTDNAEHFAGLGHDYFGRSSKLDLKGEVIKRNYGTKHYQQAPLLVPFYISSKGYGIFLNNTFPNTFSFGKDGHYGFSITGGRMDYFVIAGPEFEKLLDRYTQLTGRPRFPPKAAFGLALSDKGNDHNSNDPSDENWWKRKITEHRAAGFPIDHVVNDNRWRAGGGQRCESYFDWDPVRYPKPDEYKKWLDSNGLFITLDFNRCIGSHSEGWKPEYKIPESDSIAFGDSAPDLTKKEVRDWFWGLFWKKSLNPELHFPGDALWIDEFDEMGNSPDAMILGNGRTWREMKNYWFFLIAKALVGDGWNKSFKGSKRPFVWVRGMTAGAQRYATLWSGDIVPTYNEMKTQVRGLQAAGLSGFPFWGHDAGGFFNYQLGDGPDDIMYRQWSLAFGAFTPYWKPHGPGHSRWPLDRPVDVQTDARKYSHLRYELMPYLYTYSYIASQTGTPVARAMIIEHQSDSLAWAHDLQYMWGKEFLVAPNCSDSNYVSVWLPEGTWYDYWKDSLITGDRVITYTAQTGQLPLFVKQGSIIPMSKYAESTAFIPADHLTIHIYTGDDGKFSLYEDDGITEHYLNGEKRTTEISYNQNEITLQIDPAAGTYKNAPANRSYKIIIHGLTKNICFSINGTAVDFAPIEDMIGSSYWDVKRKTLTITTGSLPVSNSVIIKPSDDCGDL